MARIVRQNAPPRQTRRKRTTAQVEAQAQLEAARDADASRRRETRRKVVIGSALIGLARHDPDAARLLERLKRSLTRPVDRKLFDLEP